ncbi:MAG TPA: excinuclease ABC subunit UvrA [Verrucomicrobiae bacterium]|nr:excinuclease ABC subunit UvrA [Verrucomicrobiae bacterium]
MLKSSARSAIRLRGVRHNNLKNFDLDLPLNQLIVITGLSGSGKSSLAFDTLFAEGQRRYIETFSPYARQFFDRMDKPQVDSIEGIPPAIAIEQRNSVKTTRSTVGTMTEICDYMKMLWPHIAQLHCRQCGRPVRKDSPQQIWETFSKAGLAGGPWEGLPIKGPLSPTLSPSEGDWEKHRRVTVAGHAADSSVVRTLPSETKGGQNSTAGEVLITFDLPLSEKLSFQESLDLVSKQGYQRLLVGEKMMRLEELASMGTENGLSRVLGSRAGAAPASLTVIQDRVRLTESGRARFIEACEQAYHFGKGQLAVRPVDSSHGTPTRRFSNRLHCAQCNIEYHEPTPALFSFNHPVGACPTCRGFGRVISIDYERAMPDHSKTLAQGVVKPWHTGKSAECQTDLLRMCRRFGIPTDVPFENLPKKWKDFVINGEPGYGKDSGHEWPKAWYGVKGYFRWLESKSYKMHMRVLLSRYRAYTPCPDCHGKRFQPETLLYVVGRSNDAALLEPEFKAKENRGSLRPRAAVSKTGLTLADFYQLPIRDALHFLEQQAQGRRVEAPDPLGVVFTEARARLSYLEEVGLGYLTLERPTRSLSGGETERVNLTTCLGTRLVNTLFVLDEPSVGLHPRDIERLVRVLQQLRDAGNTVVVVEHEASVMRAANHIIDLGPGHGATGGNVVFQGPYCRILQSAASLTGQYLSGRRQIEIPQRRRVQPLASQTARRMQWRESEPMVLRDKMKSFAAQERRAPHGYGQSLDESENRLGGCPSSALLVLEHATKHNLKDLTVRIPLGRLVCVTGVSGSGKTTLVREVLLPALEAELKAGPQEVKASERVEGEEETDEASLPGASAGSIPRVRGWEDLGRVILVDQSILAKTPRSNPAVYIGAFDDIREFYAQSELARQRGLGASAFSFNSSQGQCERCRGAGFEKIEMQFLSDVFIRCAACNGRRYRSHIQEVKIAPKPTAPLSKGPGNGRPEVSMRRSTRKGRALSIADLLELTVEEAIEFLGGFCESRHARRAVASLNLLREVGLGYLQVGQPINTLSGGESQRLKLVRHLAEAAVTPLSARAKGSPKTAECASELASGNPQRARRESNEKGATERPTLFLFDEPTTGLHFEDVRVLLKVFQRLVDCGHSVLVIEHNLDVIKSADWILDLGPDAGDLGGQLIAQGTPEEIIGVPSSHTGAALREVLPPTRDRLSALRNR